MMLMKADQLIQDELQQMVRSHEHLPKKAQKIQNMKKVRERRIRRLENKHNRNLYNRLRRLVEPTVEVHH